MNRFATTQLFSSSSSSGLLENIEIFKQIDHFSLFRVLCVAWIFRMTLFRFRFIRVYSLRFECNRYATNMRLVLLSPRCFISVYIIWDDVTSQPTRRPHGEANEPARSEERNTTKRIGIIIMAASIVGWMADEHTFWSDSRATRVEEYSIFSIDFSRNYRRNNRISWWH